jgi:hypothetical protein
MESAGYDAVDPCEKVLVLFRKEPPSLLLIEEDYSRARKAFLAGALDRHTGIVLAKTSRVARPLELAINPAIE